MITTTKQLTVQKPRYDTDGNITDWQTEALWTFSTNEERTALMPDARNAAKMCGGRVILLTTVTDNKDSSDDTTWDVTTTLKVLVSRVVASASVTAPKDQWAQALSLIQGQPGCRALAAAIQEAL